MLHDKIELVDRLKSLSLYHKIFILSHALIMNRINHNLWRQSEYGQIEQVLNIGQVAGKWDTKKSKKSGFRHLSVYDRTWSRASY